ncbi:MAG: hypothetical protein M1812_006083 [Candelaria pacifica]|nr:MAG: hypothetical protein M1812_006083 [Candelaria pacifica]
MTSLGTNAKEASTHATDSNYGIWSYLFSPAATKSKAILAEQRGQAKEVKEGLSSSPANSPLPSLVGAVTRVESDISRPGPTRAYSLEQVSGENPRPQLLPVTTRPEKQAEQLGAERCSALGSPLQAILVSDRTQLVDGVGRASSMVTRQTANVSISPEGEEKLQEDKMIIPRSQLLRNPSPDVALGQVPLGPSPELDSNLPPLLQLSPTSSDPVLPTPSSLTAPAVAEVEDSPQLSATNAVLSALIPELEVFKIWFLYFNVHLYVHPWYDVAVNFERAYETRLEPGRLREMWARVERREDVLSLCWNVALGKAEGRMSDAGICADEGPTNGDSREEREEQLTLHKVTEGRKSIGKNAARMDDDKLEASRPDMRSRLVANITAGSTTNDRVLHQRRDEDDKVMKSTANIPLPRIRITAPNDTAGSNGELKEEEFSVDTVLTGVGHHGYVARLVSREGIQSIDALLKALQIEEEKLQARILATDLTAAHAQPSRLTSTIPSTTSQQRAQRSSAYWGSEVERDERGRIQYNPPPGEWNFDDWKRLNGSLRGEDMRRQWQPYPRRWPH